MDRNLALELVRVTEGAAVAAARWVGRGNNHAADNAAVEHMREGFNSIDFSGRIVIGEGERDEAPMLYIGEKVGRGMGGLKADLAVDPLEGTTITAKGGPNALSVIAAGPEGSLLNAPDCYMDKIAVGKKAKGKVSLEASVEENVSAVARALGKEESEVTVVILERDRHKELIDKVRKTGARIRLITDGDVSGAISTCLEESGIDLLLGIGGAPEGVIAAAAIKCLEGDFQGKLVFRNDNEKKRAREMGASEGMLRLDELVKSDAMFAATGVTDGTMLEGVRFKPDTIETHSIVMRSKTKTIRFVKGLHNDKYIHPV